MTQFFLGVHHVNWLTKAGVPLFVSRRRLAKYRRLPRASHAWALDSGGFTEIALHGCWALSERDYVAEARRYRDDVGLLSWAAPQDWMCEPKMLRRTGLTVAEHQQRTLDNFLELQHLAPEMPWVPVLQGWTEADYHRHVNQYARAGIDLAARPLVGIGTVCRRQRTGMVAGTVLALTRQGLHLHGFGVKLQGLQRVAGYLASADSQAWSTRARNAARHGEPPLIPAHVGKHKACNNCLEWALMWRAQVQARLLEPEKQYSLAI